MGREPNSLFTRGWKRVGARGAAGDSGAALQPADGAGVRSLGGAVRPAAGVAHPKELGEAEVAAFLTSLAADGGVSSSTQSQAASALLFLYGEVLERPLQRIEGVLRPRAVTRMPVVLTADEVRQVLRRLRGVNGLVAQMADERTHPARFPSTATGFFDFPDQHRCTNYWEARHHHAPPSFASRQERRAPT